MQEWREARADDVAERGPTHLSSPLIESFHLASHVTVFLCSTSPHLCAMPSPKSGTVGTCHPRRSAGHKRAIVRVVAAAEVGTAGTLAFLENRMAIDRTQK